jgi:hypothetical protein
MTSYSVSEDEAEDFVVATLSVAGGSGVYSFTLDSQTPVGTYFKISGDELQLAATDLDYETNASHSLTITADNGVDDPITQIVEILVLDVSEPVGPAGDGIQLETGDFLLAENGDYLIQEAA